MGLPQLRPEETASHDLTVFYHVAGRAGSDRCCEADAPGVAGTAHGQATLAAGSEYEDRDRAAGHVAAVVGRPVRRRLRADRRLPSATGVPPRASRLSFVVGVVARGRSHARCDVQLVGQERPEGCASHSASDEDRHHPAVPRPAGDRPPGSPGAREYLPTGLVAEGAVAAQHRDAPFAVVFSRSGTLSAQLPRRVVHGPAALHALPGRGAAVHEGGLRGRGPRADRRTQGRQSALARGLLRHGSHEPGSAGVRVVGGDAHVSHRARGISGAVRLAQAA